MSDQALPLTSVTRWGLAITIVLVGGVSKGWCAEAAPRPVLSNQTQDRVDTAVESGLRFLATHQREDGSFSAPYVGQPGITSLCVMAFLAGGYMPDSGPYADSMSQAINYVRSAQQSSGMIFGGQVGSRWSPRRPSHTAVYNHAVSGLMLAEIYGMTDKRNSESLRQEIYLALEFSRSHQERVKRLADDHGGWQYLRPYQENDADVSVTSWQLMFYRAAKNSGFEVPVQHVDEATDYIRRCFDPDAGTFVYRLAKYRRRLHTTGAAGGGILALSLGGQHDTDIARRAGDWILARDFTRYNRGTRQNERYHYGLFYCSQAMFQLGGKYWSDFYPPVVETLCDSQQPDGAWQRESGLDGVFGNSYTTALCILALTPPYQTLPLYQR